MGKVSIGLRGWRFDEEAVLSADGSLRPVDEMATDVRDRVLRLSALVGSPCNACWLIHGDDEIAECNVAEIVYGEPLSEVVLCADHEPDFLYWYREAGGDAYRGTDEFQDAFHEWFADGGRAPADYGGMEHVDTDPDGLPEPPPVDQSATVGDEDGERIDLRDVDLGADYPTE